MLKPGMCIDHVLDGEVRRPRSEKNVKRCSKCRSKIWAEDAIGLGLEVGVSLDLFINEWSVRIPASGAGRRTWSCQATTSNVLNVQLTVTERVLSWVMSIHCS